MLYLIQLQFFSRLSNQFSRSKFTGMCLQNQSLILRLSKNLLKSRDSKFISEYVHRFEVIKLQKLIYLACGLMHWCIC
ncbi:hypothetical protein D3C75_779940 [compost metagenome]